VTAAPIEPTAGDPLTGDYEVIHLGGEAAAVVPLDELRRLKALEQAATPEALDAAEGAALSASMDEWIAAGCPGAMSHEEFMIEVFGHVPK
jgi:hypothetical protein